MAANRKDVVNSPAGGWGALNAVETHLARQETLIRGNRALLAMNKPGGFDCPSCAWPDPRRPHTFEYCENGAKAVAWEATHKRATPDFFAQHTVEELRRWTDHDLEDVGRLTHPLRYNSDTDKYEAISWDERDIEALGLYEGACVEFTAVAKDGIERRVSGFKVVSYDIPTGCCAAYYPETNALLALSHRDERSNTPAAKSVPVRVTAMRPGEPVSADSDVSEDGCHRSTDPQTVPLA